MVICLLYTSRELERENERLRNEIEKLNQRVSEQDRQITDLGKQNADLERKLGLKLQNSTTSSKPPSSDGLAGKQRPRCTSRRRKSGRKPGGQPGHPGHHRGLFPPERVNVVIPVHPTQCGQCDKAFGDRARATQGEPQRHQVTELPKIVAHVTEYQCHKLRCGKCGNTTQAALPEEVKGNFGPELTALIAYQTVTCRMPRRVVLKLSLIHI